MAYVTVDRFKLLALIPSEWIDAIEVTAPGWTDAQLDYLSGWIDTRLRKRYAVPFAAPVPQVIEGWVTRLLTLRALLRRGVDPTDAQFAQIQKDYDSAESELREAADAKEGLFDLPLRADNANSAVTQASPKSYTEQSPWTAADIQRALGRQEDQIDRG